MGWNPFRDSWTNWSDDPSRRGSDRRTQERAGLEDWRRTHSIDPNTGDIIGPPGLVPAELGLEYQFLHEQGRDRARQNRMRSAANYARGALGLLQSFRPGGGATLEAGQYNALAQIEQNRAQMLQPLDLLGDYRRDESARANQRANRARANSTIVQLAALAVSAYTGGVGGAALAGLGMAGNALFGGGGGAPSAPDDESRGYQSRTATRVPGQPQGDSGFGAQPTGEQQQLRQEERTMGLQMQQPGGEDQQKRVAPGMMPQQPGGKQQQPSAGPGGPAGGAGGGGGGFQMGGGAPTVGADGNFQPVAYAAASAGQMIDPLQNVVMSLSLADRLDADPAWDQISFAVDQRLRMRVRGAAA